MGRRPSVRSAVGSGLSLSSFSPEVKSELNEIALIFFKEAKKRIKEKIDKDEFDALTLKELMDMFGKTLKSLQGPATSLQQINVPQTPQLPQNTGPRPIELRKAAMDPEKIKTMREQQEKYLDNNGA